VAGEVVRYNSMCPGEIINLTSENLMGGTDTMDKDDDRRVKFPIGTGIGVYFS